MDVVIAVVAGMLVVLALVTMLAKYVMGEQAKMAQNYEYMMKELESRAAQLAVKERELRRLRSQVRRLESQLGADARAEGSDESRSDGDEEDTGGTSEEELEEVERTPSERQA